MNKYNMRSHMFVAVLFWTIFYSTLSASVILNNEGIIGERAVEKIEIMGKELEAKTGIHTYVSVINSLDGQPIAVYEKDIEASLQAPFILLTLAKEEHQVDIHASNEMFKLFDKEGVLSPYPWTGTIIPLLTTKKATDKYSAAILNGYADIVEQVAKNRQVVLESAIGNANKDTLAYVRWLIYGMFAWIVATVILKKVRKKHATATA